MFTGIIRSVGEIYSTDARGGSVHIVVRASGIDAALGSSVAVSGVCLTVMGAEEGGLLQFDVMDATLRRSTVGLWKVGTKVNLESALKAGDELGGHFVYGHVDAVAHIVSAPEGLSVLRIALSDEMKPYIAPRGSVAIDGVSLTVADVTEKDFTVGLVPYTLEHTTLRRLNLGDKVNVEADMLAKYASRPRLHFS